MANFVYDSFTATDGSKLDGRMGETGANWTKHPAFSSGDSQIQSNALEGASFNDSYYFAGGSPATAEYDVVVPWKALIVSGDYGGGVVARMDTTAATCYLAEHFGGTWYLAKLVAGTRTALGSYAQTLTAGTTYSVKLEIRDAAKKLFIDGVERISSADNSITAAGKAGVKLYQGASAHACSMLDFTATDLTVANAAPTFSGTIANISGTQGTALTGVDVASLFSDTDTLTYSKVGTWPGGVTLTGSTIGGTPTVNGTFAGLSVRATDTAAQTVDSNAFTITLAASGDTTPPTLTGAITPSAITQSGFTISWPAGADNVAVTGYEYSTNGGSTYTDAGNVLTKTVTGLAASTAYSVTVRAYDAAGNKSTPALAATVTTSAAAVAGTITTPQPLKNNTATVQPNLTGLVVQVLLGSTGAPVVSKTGQTTNSSGFLAVNDAAITPGTAYFLAFVDPTTGAAGITNKITAV